MDHQAAFQDSTQSNPSWIQMEKIVFLKSWNKIKRWNVSSDLYQDFQYTSHLQCQTMPWSMVILSFTKWDHVHVTKEMGHKADEVFWLKPRAGPITAHLCVPLSIQYCNVALSSVSLNCTFKLRSRMTLASAKQSASKTWDFGDWTQMALLGMTATSSFALTLFILYNRGYWVGGEHQGKKKTTWI